MSGIDYVADTNILIYILDGKAATDQFMENTFAASVVSEMELLGWYKITETQKQLYSKLITKLFVVELSNEIKQIAIEIKQRNKIKLPDSIIAATAIYLDVPLVTADRGFEKIDSLTSLIISI